MGSADSTARRRCSPRGLASLLLIYPHQRPRAAPYKQGLPTAGRGSGNRRPLPLQLHAGHTWGHCRDLGGVGQAPPEARPAPSTTCHPLTEPLSCRPYKGRGGPTARSADLNACGQGPACISGGKEDGRSQGAPEARGGGAAGEGHRCPTGATGASLGGWGWGTGRRQSRRKRKEGRGQATKTPAYLRRGLGEGGPSCGRAGWLWLMVDSDLGGGGWGAIWWR